MRIEILAKWNVFLNVLRPVHAYAFAKKIVNRTRRWIDTIACDWDSDGLTGKRFLFLKLEEATGSLIWPSKNDFFWWFIKYCPFYLRQHANLGVLTTLRIGHDNTGKLSLSFGYTFVFFSLLSAYFVLLFFPHSWVFSYPNKEVWFSVLLGNRRWSIRSLQINDKLEHRWRQ